MSDSLVRYVTAGLVLIVLATHLGLVHFISISLPGPVGAFSAVTTSVFLVGLLAGAAGLFLGARWWGFVALYVATVLATGVLGICMVPFVLWPVPAEHRTLPLLLLNLLFLLWLVALHARSTTRPRGAV